MSAFNTEKFETANLEPVQSADLYVAKTAASAAQQLPECSAPYLQYLQQQKRRLLWIRMARLLVLAVFLAGWELSARLHWVDSMLTGMPSQIVSSFSDLLLKGKILNHTLITGQETLLGFCVSMIIGTLLAILLWWSAFLSKVLDPYLVVLNALPKVALGPIFYIWLGDRLSIYGMAIAISIIVTVIMLESGFKEISKTKLKLMESFGATRWQMLRMVVLPASIPNFVATMKVNVGLTLVGVIMGEFLSSKAGLGFLIIYGGQVFQMNLVMTSIALLAILSIVLYGVITYIGNLMLKKYHFE
ncbi:ABC transporter permease [Effusibacillus pohliae]|uniref:ABC transporter permease n=1 Tax=Effusibacillus pohliae TaxID=232270 RepID=UPI0003655E02|nr:ABC transporter permease [Effusibacillus pohliae]